MRHLPHEACMCPLFGWCTIALIFGPYSLFFPIIAHLAFLIQVLDTLKADLTSALPAPVDENEKEIASYAMGLVRLVRAVKQRCGVNHHLSAADKEEMRNNGEKMWIMAAEATRKFVPGSSSHERRGVRDSLHNNGGEDVDSFTQELPAYLPGRGITLLVTNFQLLRSVQPQKYHFSVRQFGIASETSHFTLKHKFLMIALMEMELRLALQNPRITLFLTSESEIRQLPLLNASLYGFQRRFGDDTEKACGGEEVVDVDSADAVPFGIQTVTLDECNIFEYECQSESKAAAGKKWMLTECWRLLKLVIAFRTTFPLAPIPWALISSFFPDRDEVSLVTHYFDVLLPLMRSKRQVVAISEDEMNGLSYLLAPRKVLPIFPRRSVISRKWNLRSYSDINRWCAWFWWMGGIPSDFRARFGYYRMTLRINASAYFNSIDPEHVLVEVALWTQWYGFLDEAYFTKTSDKKLVNRRLFSGYRCHTTSDDAELPLTPNDWPLDAPSSSDIMNAVGTWRNLHPFIHIDWNALFGSFATAASTYFESARYVLWSKGLIWICLSDEHVAY